jgi:ketosteroid isomerase-like protein
MIEKEEAVLGANQIFYKAFNNKDFESMENLWSSNKDIAVIHPGWPPVLGQESVLSSWKGIFEGGMSPAVNCANISANILGNTAIVICTELLEEGELVATNIFVLEEDAWKMVHHQSGPLPPTNTSVNDGALH